MQKEEAQLVSFGYYPNELLVSDNNPTPAVPILNICSPALWETKLSIPTSHECSQMWNIQGGLFPGHISLTK
ncbi:hypothetical protein H5410_006910 [Solanum commersonii]|uniref:Uncharacterized protein n=1 Tax=Solanum commersonii TaxID=4109 RepID=A0A9J6ABJ7_SOLCO|nr:hypothetical protein H5410_006910 [Solanum commersonii]